MGRYINACKACTIALVGVGPAILVTLFLSYSN